MSIFFLTKFISYSKSNQNSNPRWLRKKSHSTCVIVSFSVGLLIYS